jgi:transcriptional regulator with XRE-family HTH domain
VKPDVARPEVIVVSLEVQRRVLLAFGDAVRRERERRHLSRAELSTRSGVSEGIIEKIENSIAVRSEELTRIGAAFGMQFDEFMQLVEASEYWPGVQKASQN